jgi:hypothetical protein
MKQLTRDDRVAEEPQAWCDECCVRVAPYEDFVTHKNRKFHRLCFLKLEGRSSRTRALAVTGSNAATA